MKTILLLFAACGIFSLAVHAESETQKPALLIVQVWLKPNTADIQAEYQAAFMPLAKTAGAQPVARHTGITSLRGGGPPDYITILEFPSEASIRELFSSEKSKALDPLRQRLFANIQLWIVPNP